MSYLDAPFKKKLPSLTVTTDAVSGQVTSVDSFSFDRASYTSVMVRGPGDDLMLTGMANKGCVILSSCSLLRGG